MNKPSSAKAEPKRIEYRQDMSSNEFREYVLQQCQKALKRLRK